MKTAIFVCLLSIFSGASLLAQSSPASIANSPYGPFPSAVGVPGMPPWLSQNASDLPPWLFPGASGLPPWLFPSASRLAPRPAYAQGRKTRSSKRAASLAAKASLDASSIFIEAPFYSSGGFGADSVAVADLNGDGKLDLVVANRRDLIMPTLAGSVAILLGNGDATFQPAVAYDSGGFLASSVAVADVNQDGHPDLLVANLCASEGCTFGGEVSVLLGNGDGTFQPAVSYSSGNFGDVDATSVAVADVNGDGKPDLLVVNECLFSDSCHGHGGVGVLLGNGDGTFQPAVVYDSGGRLASSLAVADIDADGKPDLVVTNACAAFCQGENGSVAVLLGLGDGTFRAPVVYDSGGQVALSVVAGDVNGDGKPDLLVANMCGSGCPAFGVASVFIGNGDGTFQPAVGYGSGADYPLSVALGDANGDGKPDLLVGGGSGSASVLLGSGDGTFQPALSYGSGGVGAVSVAVADVNRDGKADVLVANSNNDDFGGVGVLLGNGDGTLQAAPRYGSGGYGPETAALADVNGDGKLDLLFANQCLNAGNCLHGFPGPGGVGVLLGNGDGTFQVAVSFDSGGDVADSVAAADVNADGKPDLLVANSCSDDTCTHASVGVLLGNGDGTFQPAVNYDSGGLGASALAVADVNRDSNLDLVVANSCSDSMCNNDATVSVLLGNGGGTFQAPVGYDSAGVSPDSVVVADVNGDGKPDVVVANRFASTSDHSKGSVSVLLGNGNGTFQPAVPYNPGGVFATGAVVVADINGTVSPICWSRISVRRVPVAQVECWVCFWAMATARFNRPCRR